MSEKRGFTHAEAMAYVGVKRRTFDTEWRPRLVAMVQGACTIYDRGDLDQLFDLFKQEAAGAPLAANDAGNPLAQNGPRNGRPSTGNGEKTWAKKQPESIRTETDGTSTSGTEKSDFLSEVSRLRQRRKAG